MKTPAGKECKYYYADYFRGREKEECQLLRSANPPLTWKRELCMNCPVPDILMANACQHMILTPKIVRPFPYIKHQVQINAYCAKTNRLVKEPHVGCGECHPLPFTLPGHKN